MWSYDFHSLFQHMRAYIKVKLVHREDTSELLNWLELHYTVKRSAIIVNTCK